MPDLTLIRCTFSLVGMATDISKIEDGFALRRGVKKKKKATVKGECTIPPTIPKHVLGTLVMSSPRSKKAIANYVEIQARETGKCGFPPKTVTGYRPAMKRSTKTVATIPSGGPLWRTGGNLVTGIGIAKVSF